MKKYIQDAMLDLAGLPKGVLAKTEKFDDVYVTVVAEKHYVDENRRFCLPGAMVLEDRENVFSLFGVSAPEFKAIVVLDKTIDLEKGITKEDIEYFKNLDDFKISCNLRMVELDVEDIFRPLESLIHNSEPVSSNEGFVEYKSAINGKSVFVKQGSNRHRFIKGQTDFLDDPFDFYVHRDVTILPNEVEHCASIKGTNEFIYMFDRLNDNTLSACISLFSSSPNMKEIAKNAIRLRETVSSSFSAEVYWDEFEEQPARLSKFSDINWDTVAIALRKAKDTDAGYNSVSHLIAVDADAYSWGPYTVHIFFIFYMLLEDDKIEFIKNTFNL